MGNQGNLHMLPQLLLPWYETNKRDLPWRKDKDPYHIWVSEIMLQQTRVEAVRDYYVRFLSVLPTIESLANADDELLHKLWEGLGYYSRVRNLKKAAQVICDKYDGCFPMEYDKILALPGIGPYTAGAVSSIAFDLQTPAVDGNVLRVFARVTDNETPIDSPAFKKLAFDRLKEIYPELAGDFTQALMELGATVCGPNRTPDCDNCPCAGVCIAHEKGREQQLPVKKPKKQRKHEEKTVYILSCDGEYALEKRPASGLLAGLWQFPNVTGRSKLPDALLELEKLGLRVRDVLRKVERSHIFTHVQWDMVGIYAEVCEKGGTFVWMSAEEIRSSAALPTAFRQFWEVIENV